MMFCIGSMFGSFLTFIIFCLCVYAKKDDERDERRREENKDGK